MGTVTYHDAMPQFPPAALEWMVHDTEAPVLTLGGSPSIPKLIAGLGHRVFAVHKDDAAITSLTRADVVVVKSEPEALPFQPCTFGSVICHQVFSEFAPGLALSEVARVLAPGGAFCVSLLRRDDSVPWVRRLIGRVQQIDANAMSGKYGVEAIEPLLDSKYFPEHETREFRLWVPVSSDELVTMVTSALPDADAATLAELSDDLHQLYAESAPAGGRLRLPYALQLWRAYVDHAELTAPIEYDDSGLVIPI